MLAMHMANELLTPSVAGLFTALSAGVLVWASRRMRTALEPDKVPLMGVMGAFVFAAQMINFPVLPGTSGHLGGGVLLAILLGPHAATLVMAAILIIQCLIFQDGGLLALGTNILNLGIIPCYLGYGVFRLAAGRSPSAGRLYLAVFIAAVVGVTGGASMVPVQAWVSGVTTVPLTQFLLVMIGLHLLIAAVEAVITFLVVAYVSKVRPEFLGPAADQLRGTARPLSPAVVVGSILLTALLLGGVVSLFASAWPDALESITAPEEAPETAMVRPSDDQLVTRAEEWQQRVAPLPDYQWTSLSGVIGTLLTLAAVWGIGRVLAARRTAAATGHSHAGGP